MSVIRHKEMDRPTFNTLQYLTTVKAHKIVKEPLYVDAFNRQLIIELYGIDPVRAFEGTTRSFYSLEGHYHNLWKFDKPILPKPNDAVLDEAIRRTTRAFALMSKPKAISWDSLNTVPFISTSGAGYGYPGKKGEPGNLDRAIRLAGAHLNAFKEERLGLKNKTFRFTPDLAWTRTSLGTFTDPKIRHVWGTAFHNILIEGIIAAPLIQAYTENDHPIITGSSIQKRLPQIIHHCIGSGDAPFTGVGLDYSSFDSSLQPWLMNIAFDIIGQNIIIDEEMQEYAFEFSKHYFSNRPVVMPDDRMWLKRIGLPSGSYFTQLVGSICNHITMMYIQLSLPYKNVLS